MKPYLRALVIGASVYMAARLVFWLLLPWTTYERAFCVVGSIFFIASAVTFARSWRARGINKSTSTSSSQKLLFRGVLFLAVGVAWFATAKWLLHG